MRLAPLKLVLLTVLDLCLFFLPDPRLLDSVSLFLTDERSDAAVVAPFLTFLRLGQFEACRTWGSIRTIKSS